MSSRSVAITKTIIFLSCLIPFAWLVWGLIQGQLGANPVEMITHTTGDWALNFLLLTLAISLLYDLTGQKVVFRFRRMLGLYVFFYALMHLLTWLVFDHFFDWQEILKDIFKRPYITVGFIAFILLIPLTVTSTDRIRQYLGSRWYKLHQMIFVVAVLVIFHYLWLVKADNRTPIIYGLVVILLLAYRSWRKRRLR